MRDWAIEYLHHVLEKKDWSATRLAEEAGVAVSTISRPLRTPDYANNLSRRTIAKIKEASGIDPEPFIPKNMAEDAAFFSTQAKARGLRVIENLSQADDPPQQDINTITFSVSGRVAHISATIDADGIERLRRNIDLIESALKS